MTTEKEYLLVERNNLHARLEVARRMDDSDSAEAICGALQNIYRRLVLLEKQTKQEAVA